MSRRDHNTDSSDRPAQSGELKLSMEKILELPVSTAAGLIYQFANIDERKMRKVQSGLSASGGSVNWRQLNNNETTLDAAGLSALIDELELRQFQRGLLVDAEYMTFKTSGCTRRQLIEWKAKYANGFIP